MKPRPTRAPPNAMPDGGPLGILIDVEMACLYVAKWLEHKGRHGEASYLRLDLGQKLIRAGLHEAEHPGPVTLGKELARLVGLAGDRISESISESGKRTKKARR